MDTYPGMIEARGEHGTWTVSPDHAPIDPDFDASLPADVVIALPCHSDAQDAGLPGPLDREESGAHDAGHPGPGRPALSGLWELGVRRVSTVRNLSPSPAAECG